MTGQDRRNINTTESSDRLHVFLSYINAHRMLCFPSVSHLAHVLVVKHRVFRPWRRRRDQIPVHWLIWILCHKAWKRE